MFSLIGTLVIGFLAGLAARFIKPGDDSMGTIATTGLGIVGAFVGSQAGQLSGLYEADQPAGFVAAVLGAIAVLFGLKLVTGKK